MQYDDILAISREWTKSKAQQRGKITMSQGLYRLDLEVQGNQGEDETLDRR